MSNTERRECPGPTPEHLLAVREGHGANCSSIGSVVDTLFASAVVGGAVFAAVLAAMKREPITVVPAHNRRQDERAGTAGGDDPGQSE